MKKPLKILLTVLIVFIVGVVGLIAALPALANGVIREQVEVQAGKALQTNVAIGGVNFALFEGAGGIQDLTIDNLPGYENPRLMELGNVQVDVGLKSLRENPIRIQHLKIDDITVTLEQKGTTNNIKELLNNLPKEDKPREEKTEPGKDIVIEKLEITGVTVKVKLIPLPGKIDTSTIKLDPIVMENVGTGEHMDVGKLTRVVFSAIVTGILKQGTELPGELIKGLGEGLEDLGGLTLDLLEETGEVLEEGVKEIGQGLQDIGDEIGKGIGDGLGDLFKKDKKEQDSQSGDQ